ncbi:MAG: ribose-phosphate pyrophosphokinase [Ignavibacteria bacterium]|jgi:ribose-phosphate pyrophosphokinase|nr:ribose-phosphate pyrophosphokinase [Ignavibacteria bacterium]
MNDIEYTEMVVFSGRSSMDLAQRIADHIGQPLGRCEIKTFSDGELWMKYGENIRGKDVFIIQSTFTPAENLMELLILLDAARRSSARRITAVIPYFGYARQDRKDQPRVAITAKLVANLIRSAGADRIISMDLHAPQIQGFFDIPLDHLYSSAVFIPHFKARAIPNLAVVSPDVGGIKMARAYAKRLDADLIVLDKRRDQHNRSEVLNIIGSVEGKNVLVVDDIIDTGGTFSNAITALRNAGALQVFGACTHPVLSGKAADRLVESRISLLSVTDTIPLRENVQKTGLVEVLSVAELFAEAIMRTHLNQSISSLFDVDKDKIM